MAEHGRVRQEERYAEKIRSKKRCSAMCRQTSEYLRIIPCQARVLQQAASALIAVSNAFTCCAALSRSAFNCAIMSKSPPRARIVAEPSVGAPCLLRSDSAWEIIEENEHGQSNEVSRPRIFQSNTYSTASSANGNQSHRTRQDDSLKRAQANS